MCESTAIPIFNDSAQFDQIVVTITVDGLISDVNVAAEVVTDRRFVAAADDSGRDHRLVEGVIAPATILDINVTAEGVESAEQAVALRRMGCPSAQGYLSSRAVPVEQLTPLLDHTYAVSPDLAQKSVR